MHPVLFQIGVFPVYSYGVMLALAVLLCAWGLGRDASKMGISKDAAYDLLFWSVAGGIIGARIFYVTLYWDHFAAAPLEILMNRWGLAWQGGFLGGILAGIVWCKRRAYALRPMLDLAAPYIALGQAVGRLGCFFNGCCYGRPWVHGIFFPVHNARLYPTQLYEAAGLLLIFIVLKIYAVKPRSRGMVFAMYLWLAAVERFFVEFFRADHDTLWWGLSLFQYIAVGIFLTGLIYGLFIHCHRRA
ncbi:MAG: prolipoprotein diacylglyceryl transferase [Candidatus Omnitrophica bacterium]|nr:prolipoprotein diacylglyceryl transferase [Candidatus Omnitrophota bacterium]